MNDTTLLALAKDNKVAEVQSMLNNGVSPNSSNGVGQTALHIASIWGALDVARMLVDAGADISPANRINGATPLHMAAQRNRSEIVEFLLEKGASLKTKDMGGRPPYEYAQEDSLRERLGGPSTKLHLAITSNAPLATLKELVPTTQPNGFMANSDGDTPLHLACKCGGEKALELARIIAPASGECGSYKNDDGFAPIHIAIEAHEPKLVEILLDAGADINCKSEKIGEYHGGSFTRVNMETGEQEQVDDAHQTPLVMTCCLEAEDGEADIAGILLARGADVNARDVDGYTALHYALEEENLDMAKMILSAPNQTVDLSVGNSDTGSLSPLHHCCANRKADAAKLLLEFGADCNLAGKGGWKPMFLAARSGSLECLKMLHATGKVDAKELDANGKSCLTFAQANKRADCVAFLESL